MGTPQIARKAATALPQTFQPLQGRTRRHFQSSVAAQARRGRSELLSLMSTKRFPSPPPSSRIHPSCSVLSSLIFFVEFQLFSRVSLQMTCLKTLVLCSVTDRPPLRAGIVSPELPVPDSIARPPYTNNKKAPDWCDDYMIHDAEVRYFQSAHQIVAWFRTRSLHTSHNMTPYSCLQLFRN